VNARRGEIITNKTGALVVGIFLSCVAVVLAVAAVPSYAGGGGPSTPSAKPEFSVTLGNITYHGVQASNVGIAIVSATPRQTNATGYVVAAVVMIPQ
jgi:hypothetical protein